ncbi:heme ABC exporter ATP-binding protein CcmA [Candidatus Berkiella cookevillensis]|uniref:Cytochrome c biogenesis ATP-binding export protein CcmA n=1 Tax=Candidatus Berkiella cookevillensis TaxID=437022 RepID=A0A0Q9YGY1_9GAMM|nr:heme ABC exporter ATP-binding protein CcmA [Candidatus Berkiella cookevillensis]MCS5708588.1 heme ABC exporter ATP-binding protein CcmA [Candidatus Berkiella cookevillensis]
MNSPYLLKVDNLQYQLFHKIIIQPVSFFFERGKLLQVIGANGSGKSTLLKLLTGLLRFDEGTVKWCFDGSNDCDVHQAQSYLSYVGHQNGLKKDMSVLENIELSFMVLSEKILPKTWKESEDVKALLKALDLYASRHKLVKALSFGQRRKVALARVFLLNKPVWILDEPFVGLDEKTTDFVKSRLEMHCEKNNNVIISSHSQQDFCSISKMHLLRLNTSSSAVTHND